MSMMRTETLEIPKIITAQLLANTEPLQDFAEKLRERKPEFVLTIARGSSDHAATFIKYLCETQFGLLVSSAAPSVYTLYQAPVKLKKGLAIALSQSGQSPDICEVMRHAREEGALTLALVNETASPLAKLAEYVLPLHAGAEKAVAATKSYMAMLVASLHLLAILKEDQALFQALQNLPKQLLALENLNFSSLFGTFKNAENALIIGRGFSFAIAEEVALKFKEVTQIHAEGFSGAEVLHGPFSLFHEAFPVVILLQNDATLPSTQALIDRIRKTPVKPILVGDIKTLKGNEDLPHLLLPETHPLAMPILAVFVLYQFIEALAQLQGLNPDTPPLIQKVTKTV